MKMSKVRDEIKKRSLQSETFENEYQMERTRLDIAVIMTDLRKSLGYTQAQFSEVLGVPQSTISRLETGKMNPTIEFVSQIASKVGKRVKLEIVD